jgi:aconitase A
MGFMEEIFTVGNGSGIAFGKIAFGKNGHNMKRNRQILKARTRLSLGDLILAVSSCTNSSRETVATVADLLASGRVRVHDNGRFLRARVC